MTDRINVQALWVEGVVTDAAKVRALNLTGKQQRERVAQIADAMEAIAAGRDFDQGDVYRQRTQPNVIVSNLSVRAARELLFALHGLQFSQVQTVKTTQPPALAYRSVEIALRPPPVPMQPPPRANGV